MVSLPLLEKFGRTRRADDRARPLAHLRAVILVVDEEEHVLLTRTASNGVDLNPEVTRLEAADVDLWRRDLDELRIARCQAERPSLVILIPKRDLRAQENPRLNATT